MKIVIAILLFLPLTGLCQDRDLDLALLREKTEQEDFRKSEKRLKGFLRIYQRHLSDQILNDCIYEHSCSTFSQGAIDRYGLVKGAFLSADRLMRCNRASMIDLPPVRFTHENKIKDHWEAYSFRR